MLYDRSQSELGPLEVTYADNRLLLHSDTLRSPLQFTLEANIKEPTTITGTLRVLQSADWRSPGSYVISLHKLREMDSRSEPQSIHSFANFNLNPESEDVVGDEVVLLRSDTNRMILLYSGAEGHFYPPILTDSVLSVGDSLSFVVRLPLDDGSFQAISFSGVFTDTLLNLSAPAASTLFPSRLPLNGSNR